uniref:Epidermal differentiation protein n=1 Tax=Anas platyrhynchos platyrhynchos TaxID=8840 RepID=A0A493TUM5_ANAPP
MCSRGSCHSRETSCHSSGSSCHGSRSSCHDSGPSCHSTFQREPVPQFPCVTPCCPPVQPYCPQYTKNICKLPPTYPKY